MQNMLDDVVWSGARCGHTARWTADLHTATKARGDCPLIATSLVMMTMSRRIRGGGRTAAGLRGPAERHECYLLRERLPVDACIGGHENRVCGRGRTKAYGKLGDAVAVC